MREEGLNAKKLEKAIIEAFLVTANSPKLKL
jgi:hypothetical protein